MLHIISSTFMAHVFTPLTEFFVCTGSRGDELYEARPARGGVAAARGNA